ncbi:MAG: Fe-S protein assembly co-chaperone HscB [Thiotrichaceae bacterium]
MSVDLTKNYFEVFGLPVQYNVDLDALASSFRKLQTQVHPDKFVNGTDEERRIAIQSTGFLNEASDTLRNERLRARYLLTLKGVEFSDESGTTNDQSFLMQQLEIRGLIEDAESADDPFAELDQIRKMITSRKLDVVTDFQTSYDQGDFVVAKQAVQKLRFCERIFSEIRSIEERLDDF